MLFVVIGASDPCPFDGEQALNSFLKDEDEKTSRVISRNGRLGCLGSEYSKEPHHIYTACRTTPETGSKGNGSYDSKSLKMQPSFG